MDGISEVIQPPVLKYFCVKCKETHPFRMGCKVWQDMKALMRQHVDIDEDCWNRRKV